MFITWLWIRAVSPPCLLPLLPLHLPAPHRTLPWRGDDDSNCMYYTTTCNTMGHGSIGLTLSMPACLAACLAFARVRAASHRPLPAQRMIQDDESEVVWGDPDHRLMTMRHLSDELICPAHTTPPQPRACVAIIPARRTRTLPALILRRGPTFPWSCYSTTEW